MAGYKSVPKQSSNFILSGEASYLTRKGKEYLDNCPEEDPINEWLDAAQNAVEENQPLPARPQLSDLGAELLQLLWPE